MCGNKGAIFLPETACGFCLVGRRSLWKVHYFSGLIFHKRHFLTLVKLTYSNKNKKRIAQKKSFDKIFRSALGLWEGMYWNTCLPPSAFQREHYWLLSWKTDMVWSKYIFQIRNLQLYQFLRSVNFWKLKHTYLRSWTKFDSPLDPNNFTTIWARNSPTRNDQAVLNVIAV